MRRIDSPTCSMARLVATPAIRAAPGDSKRGGAWGGNAGELRVGLRLRFLWQKVRAAVAKRFGDVSRMKPSNERQDPLAPIFECSNRADLERHCKRAAVRKDDLVTWALACMQRLVPLQYGRFFRNDHPPHLAPSHADFDEFSSPKAGPWPRGKPPKFVAKTMQSLAERRLSAAHVFIGPTADRWHFFHFNQRDLEEYRNHWKGGPHIHLISWLTEPGTNPFQLIAEFKTAAKPVHRGLYLKCVGWHV